MAPLSRQPSPPWKPTWKPGWPWLACLAPALVTLAVMALITGVTLALNGGSPMGLVSPGTRFIQHDPQGSWGYDGQFYYAMALNIDPSTAAEVIDTPAYRYQRILFPLLARALALGSPERLPWAMIAIVLASQAVGTFLVAELLSGWGVNPWFALVYGLWIGFGIAVRYVLPEPMAFALAAGAMLAIQRDKPGLSWVLFGLALFTKEVTGIFVAAAALDLLARRRWRRLSGLILVVGLPYVLFQLWLESFFGRTGFGSGGALSTPFEVIPYMGLWRGLIAAPNFTQAALTWFFFVTAVLPSLWGVWAGWRSLVIKGSSVWAWSLLINALAIMPLPFSTFSDARAMPRFQCGLLLTLLLFAAHEWRLNATHACICRCEPPIFDQNA